MSKSRISRDEMARQVARERAAAPDYERAGVVVTSWAGRENYQCRLCAYATLDRGRMVEHLRGAHGWVEAMREERRVTSEDTAAVGGQESAQGQLDQDEVM